jgi:hypothetical protein
MSKSNVIDFTAKKIEKQSSEPMTFETIVLESIDFLLGEWERNVRSNRLNEYFKNSIPSFVEKYSRTNFMSDLTELAKLELNFNYSPIVYTPYTLDPSQFGWMVSLKIGEHRVNTPDMANECYARAFALLMYMKIKGTATMLGVQT